MTMEKIDKASSSSNSPRPPGSSDINKESGISTVILPSHFVACSRTDLAILISRMLTFLIQINDSSSKPSCDVTGLTRFHSRVPPDISVYNYLIRLAKYSSLENCVLLSAVYYIDLLSSVYPTFTLNSLTVHRFLLTATTVASKGLCDSFCTNTHYSKVGGVHCSELNILECEFLKKINYRILPRDDNINWCKLENRHQIFTMYNGSDSDIPNAIQTKPELLHENSGYNVLDTYYRKIVQLVGSFDSSPDKSKVINYTFPNLMQNINSDSISDNSDSDEHVNIQPFTEAVESISTTSKKRNLETVASDEPNIITVGREAISSDLSRASQEVNTDSTATKRHINQHREPKVSHSIEN